ncbi:MAG: DUF896 domain-containing protein [Clostridia bacterium]|nr:DUF896 domain-containing protein [Clostridia bacterium]
MKEESIKRMNELYHLHKQGKLSAEEECEWKALKQEYIDSFKASLVGQLNNTYIVDEKGNKHKLQRKADK